MLLCYILLDLHYNLVSLLIIFPKHKIFKKICSNFFHEHIKIFMILVIAIYFEIIKPGVLLRQSQIMQAINKSNNILNSSLNVYLNITHNLNI